MLPFATFFSYFILGLWYQDFWWEIYIFGLYPCRLTHGFWNSWDFLSDKCDKDEMGVFVIHNKFLSTHTWVYVNEVIFENPLDNLKMKPTMWPAALVIANTLFQQHRRRLYTWTSPDGQYQNQIYYILCSQRWGCSIQSAKMRWGADCGSDHELPIAKFRLKLKKVGKNH